MAVHGTPIRYNFIGSTGSTSQSLNLVYPGGGPGQGNAPYTLLPTDWLTLLTMNISVISASGEFVILSAPAGQSTVYSSTLLLSFGAADTTTAEWHDDCSEAMCAGQGVLPSVLGLNAASTAQLYVSGTGVVSHGPGTARPGWMAPLTPPGPSTGDTNY